jgi:hypothetical protein
MPEKWNVTEDSKTIETSGFLFRRSYSLNENRTTIRLDYSYKVKKPFLEPSEIKEYSKKVDEVYAELPFDVSHTKNVVSTNAAFNKPYVIVGLITLILAVVGLRKLNEDYDPDARPSMESHDRIGGWLFLIGFGLFINPIGLAVQITDTSFYDISRWNLLMDPANRGIGLFELYQLVVNIGFMCYAVFLCSIFIARRTSFPKLMVIFLAANLINHLIGVSFSASLDQSDLLKANTKLLLQAAVGAAIWIPYFLRSERVKGTFVNMH